MPRSSRPAILSLHAACQGTRASVAGRERRARSAAHRHTYNDGRGVGVCRSGRPAHAGELGALPSCSTAHRLEREVPRCRGCVSSADMLLLPCGWGPGSGCPPLTWTCCMWCAAVCCMWCVRALSLERAPGWGEGHAMDVRPADCRERCVRVMQRMLCNVMLCPISP
jgi:hypothetical protein